MGGEEGERRNEDRGPNRSCELETVSKSGALGRIGGQRTIQMPAWAIIAVPGGVIVSVCCMGLCGGGEEQMYRGRN